LVVAYVTASIWLALVAMPRASSPLLNDLFTGTADSPSVLQSKGSAMTAPRLPHHLQKEEGRDWSRYWLSRSVS
jgi:hypothetical protein